MELLNLFHWSNLALNDQFKYYFVLSDTKLPGGGLPYEEYMGVCHELGSYFQEKIPKKVCQFFTKIPERVKYL